MQALYLEIKNLIISTLNLEELTPEDIDTDAALFGDGLGLDSIDALELGLAVKNQYGVVLSAESDDASALLFRCHARGFYSSTTRLRMTAMTEQQTIYQEVSALLITLFEVAPEDITPEARLYEDLDLDSIDAVDMVVHLQKKTGHKIKPETFKAVRTVQDVVDVVEQLQRDA